MCGICGVVDLEGAAIDRALGVNMMELLAHRGPDSQGSVFFDGVAGNRTWSTFLGHTRLKIIDLTEAAAQPLANESRDVFVIFNGEIYNYRELTAFLTQKGHRFRSKSDTEVIVHAYEQFGDDFVAKLDGMFAFALFDLKNQRLVLARD